MPHAVSITSNTIPSSITTADKKDYARQTSIDQLAKEYGMRNGLYTIKDFTLELERIYGAHVVHLSQQRFFCLTRDHYTLITQDIAETLTFIKANGIQPLNKKDSALISNTETRPTPIHRAQLIKPTVAHIDATMHQLRLKQGDTHNPLNANSKTQRSTQDHHPFKTDHHAEKKANLFQNSVDKACHKYQLKTGLASTEDLMQCISDQYGIHVIHAIKKEFPSLAMTFALLGSDVEKAMRFINQKKIPSLNIKTAQIQHDQASAILGHRTQPRQHWVKPTPTEIDANMESLAQLDDAQSDASFNFKSASQISPTQDTFTDESAHHQARLNIADVFGIDKQLKKTDLTTKVTKWIDALEAPRQR